MKRKHLSVAIGFPCGDVVPTHTAMSLAKTTHMCAVAEIPVDIRSCVGSSIVTVARNAVLTDFLKGKSEFLFWIDSDIKWQPDDFLKVLALSHRYGVVCAAYPLKRDPPAYVCNTKEDSVFNEHGLIEIESAALGFCCIKRSIIEEIAQKSEKVWHPNNEIELYDVFTLGTKFSREKEPRKQFCGEDVAFFDDIRDLGHKIWLDPTIQLGHIGQKTYIVPMEEVNLTETE